MSVFDGLDLSNRQITAELGLNADDVQVMAIQVEPPYYGKRSTETRMVFCPSCADGRFPRAGKILVGRALRVKSASKEQTHEQL